MVGKLEFVLFCVVVATVICYSLFVVSTTEGYLHESNNFRAGYVDDVLSLMPLFAS